MRGALYREADPVARGGATGPPVASRRGDRPPWRAHWPVAPGVGDRGLSPVGGRQAPLFFFSKDFVANLKKKKLHLSPVAPIGRPGYIFKIFQNRHIFLKF